MRRNTSINSLTRVARTDRMSKSAETVDDVRTSPISVWPSKRLRPKITQLAYELGRSEGQICLAALEAIIDMIESPSPAVPQIVTMARTLREHDATMLGQRRPLLPRNRTRGK
jgi:hypothetical protein